jgi:hypothetical protein
MHLLLGIFSRLSEDSFWKRYPCIIVTGRGFPDLATRALVHQVSTRFKLPVFGIADCNPFGLALLLTYKFGSAVTLSSRVFLSQTPFDICLNSCITECLLYQRMGSKFTCDLRWLGLRPTQLPELRLGREVVGLGQVLFFVVVR